MTGRRHSICDGDVGAYSAEQIAQRYMSTPHRRMSQPLNSSFLLEARPIQPASPSTTKKKKKKQKERRSNSKTRGKGDINGISEDSLGAEDNTDEVVSPLISPSTVPKKKKKSKKNKSNDDLLDIVIIPDCQDAEKEIRTDESARFSAITDPTQLLDEDDFTASTKDTKDASLKDEIKKIPKSPKTGRKKKSTKEKTRAKSAEKKRSKTPTQARRASLTSKLEMGAVNDNTNASWGTATKPVRSKTPTQARRASLTSKLEMGAVNDNKNASWGTEKKAAKSLKASELLNLSTDPGLQVKPPSFKRSNSFHSARKQPSLTSRRSSVGSNLNSQRKLAAQAVRSKQIQDVDLKNESWEAPAVARRGSLSADVKNLYNAPYRSEKPMPHMRRSVKSFNSLESWRLDPKRDHGIPSILFISTDNPEPGFNETWDTGSFDKLPESMRKKGTVKDEKRAEESKPRSRSAGANHRRRLSNTKLREEKTARPLRKVKPPDSHVNETWGKDPRSMSNKNPLSPRLVGMLGMNRARSKSPGALKKKKSVSGLRSSPSLNSLMQKFRGGGAREKSLKAMPRL